MDINKLRSGDKILKSSTSLSDRSKDNQKAMIK